jgi:hypothetical protein
MLRRFDRIEHRLMNVLHEIAPAERRRSWLETGRARAPAIHLGVTAAGVAAVCAIAALAWYPPPYFSTADAWRTLRAFVTVNLLLGPLLTLVVFKPGKRGLKLDLTIIAAVQLAAFGYGTFSLYRDRPYFSVFAIDRFHLLARHEVDPDALADPELRTRIGVKPTVGPLLVAATLPHDAAVLGRLVEETVFEGKPDIEMRPEFWRAYAGETARAARAARQLEALAAARPEQRGAIERLVAERGWQEDAVGFLPQIAKVGDRALIIDLDTAEPLATVDVDPWGIGKTAD